MKYTWLLLLTTCIPMLAGTVTVNYLPGTLYNTGALTGNATSGDAMSGMLVTAQFADSTTRTATWATTGSGSGSATSSGFFELAITGDSYNNWWNLTNNYAGSALVSLQISAREGNTVFDTIYGVFQSPHSGSGNAFSYPSGNTYPDANVTYSDQLSIAGVFYDDLYLTLNATFTSGLGSGSSLTFAADTDSVDLNTPITPTPEPSTCGLLLIGGSALILIGRAKR